MTGRTGPAGAAQSGSAANRMTFLRPTTRLGPLAARLSTPVLPALFTACALCLALLGCRSPATRTASRSETRGLRELAIEVLGAEGEFFETPGLALDVARVVQRTAPAFSREHGLYEWRGETWSICLDVEDQGILDDPFLIHRAVPGKKGVRIARLAFVQPAMRQAATLKLYIGKSVLEAHKPTLVTHAEVLPAGARPDDRLSRIARAVIRNETSLWHDRAHASALERVIERSAPTKDADGLIYTWRSGPSVIEVECGRGHVQASRTRSIGVVVEEDDRIGVRRRPRPARRRDRIRNQPLRPPPRRTDAAKAELFVNRVVITLTDEHGTTTRRLVVDRDGKLLTQFGPTAITP